MALIICAYNKNYTKNLKFQNVGNNKGPIFRTTLLTFFSISVALKMISVQELPAGLLSISQNSTKNLRTEITH